MDENGKRRLKRKGLLGKMNYKAILVYLTQKDGWKVNPFRVSVWQIQRLKRLVMNQLLLAACFDQNS